MDVLGPVLLILLMLSGVFVWWDLMRRSERAKRRAAAQDARMVQWENGLLWPANPNDPAGGLELECRVCGWKSKFADSGVRIGRVVETMKQHTVERHSGRMVR